MMLHTSYSSHPSVPSAAQPISPRPTDLHPGVQVEFGNYDPVGLLVLDVAKSVQVVHSGLEPDSPA